MSESSRRPWEPGRFLETLNFFEAIPLVSWLRKTFCRESRPTPTPLANSDQIFDFQQTAQPQVWGALDDVVMGGVSASNVTFGPEGMVFSGTVSTANSGGFASVRSRNFDPPLDLSGRLGLTLRVQGDGQRYKVFVRDDDGWDSRAYAYSFDTTPGQWQTIQVPFSALTPVFRAKTVADAPPLNQTTVRSFQLMLSKFEYDGALNPHFQAGDFCLRVAAIGAY